MTSTVPAEAAASPPSDMDVLRESVATMAICGRSFSEIESILSETHGKRYEALDLEYQQRIFSARTRITEAEKQVEQAESAIEHASSAAVHQVELDHAKRAVERRIATLRQEIARKREAAQRERHKAAIDEASRRLEATEQKLSEQQKVALAEQMSVWQRQREQDLDRAKTEEQTLGEIDLALADARKRVAPLLAQRITKTVAGFLLWVGYGSFAAIGATLALLFPSSDDDRSPLAQVIAAVRLLIGSYSKTQTPLVVLTSSVGFLVVALALFAGLMFCIDVMLQKFDLDWRSEARRARRGRQGKRDGARNDASRNKDVPLGQPVEIRRAAYVQILASLPYVLITGAIVCLLSVTGDGKVSNSLVETYLGTVVALLMTACFVLYVVKVIDTREAADPNETAQQRRRRWFRGWEFLLVPAVAMAAVIFATATAGGRERNWGLFAVFMLLACLAVAYGVVFRGLFHDVDKLERERRRVLKGIAELTAVDPPELDDTDDIRATRDTLRREREARDELDELQWPGLVGHEEPPSRGFFGRNSRRPPRFSASAFAVSDEDAAPEHVSDLAARHEELADFDRQLAAVQLNTGRNLDALAARRDELLRELDERRTAAETLEFERKRVLWELNGRQQTQLFDLRGVHDMASAVRGYIPPQLIVKQPDEGGPR